MSNKKEKLALLALVIITAIVCLLICIKLYINHPAFLPFVKEEETSTVSSVVTKKTEPVTEAFVLTPDKFDMIPSGDADGVISFSMSSDDIPSIPDEKKAAIMENFNAIGQNYSEAGFIFLNLENGKGISFNPDFYNFGASSIKGPFCVFLSQQLLDTGKVEKSNQIKQYVDLTLLESNNDTYGSLFYSYSYMGWKNWVEEAGADDIAYYSDSFPFFKLRNMCKLWTKVIDYIDSDSENAKWVRQDMGKTTVSFIRRALSDCQVSVYNKAGYNYDDFSPEVKSLCDFGIIESNGDRYFIGFLSDMGNEGSYMSSKTTILAENCIKSIFDCREYLDD